MKISSQTGFFSAGFWPLLASIEKRIFFKKDLVLSKSSIDINSSTFKWSISHLKLWVAVNEHLLICCWDRRFLNLLSSFITHFFISEFVQLQNYRHPTSKCWNFGLHKPAQGDPQPFTVIHNQVRTTSCKRRRFLTDKQTFVTSVTQGQLSPWARGKQRTLTEMDLQARGWGPPFSRKWQAASMGCQTKTSVHNNKEEKNSSRQVHWIMRRLRMAVLGPINRLIGNNPVLLTPEQFVLLSSGYIVFF